MCLRASHGVNLISVYADRSIDCVATPIAFLVSVCGQYTRILNLLLIPSDIVNFSICGILALELTKQNYFCSLKSFRSL